MTDSAAVRVPVIPALALSSDLLLHSQLSAAAQQAGIGVAIAASIDALVAQAETGRPRLVMLDLGHAGLDPRQVVPRLKALSPDGTILAFGPHVHRQRLAEAKDAGCDVVVSRGQFHAEMQAILRRYAGGE